MFKSSDIQEKIVLSVGGSLIVPNGGIDIEFLKDLNSFIRKHVKKGRKFFIVTGGGRTARRYRDAGKEVIGEITEWDLDWLGIHSTHLNAHLLRTIFQDIAHPRIIENYDKKLTNWKESVVIGSGWKPGRSTDYDAVLLAKDYNATVLINLSNIDWVYNKDPAKHKDANPIKKTTWTNFQKLVGEEWSPGSNAPFDPVASRFAKKLGLTVIIANGKNFANLDNVLNGKQFIGTIITPKKIDAAFYNEDYYEGKKGEYPLGYAETFLGNFIQNLANMYRAFCIKFFLNPKNCLDIGCGTGKLVHYLRKLGIKAHGVDISQYALDKADKEVKPYLKYGTITRIPFDDDSFDAVVTFDVLEHLERSKLKKAVTESVRVSRKWVLHKVYTTENKWITYSHKKDYSHLSVLPRKYWLKMFKYVEEITVVRNFACRLPSFFETIFLLRKNS